MRMDINKKEQRVIHRLRRLQQIIYEDLKRERKAGREEESRSGFPPPPHFRENDGTEEGE